MFGMENRVNGGEADVLVAAPVAGDEMRIEHLVVVHEIMALAVVWQDSACGIHDVVCIGLQHATNGNRNGIVRDIVKEGVSGSNDRSDV